MCIGFTKVRYIRKHLCDRLKGLSRTPVVKPDYAADGGTKAQGKKNDAFQTIEITIEASKHEIISLS